MLTGQHAESEFRPHRNDDVSIPDRLVFRHNKVLDCAFMPEYAWSMVNGSEGQGRDDRVGRATMTTPIIGVYIGDQLTDEVNALSATTALGRWQI